MRICIDSIRPARLWQAVKRALVIPTSTHGIVIGCAWQHITRFFSLRRKTAFSFTRQPCSKGNSLPMKIPFARCATPGATLCFRCYTRMQGQFEIAGLDSEKYRCCARCAKQGAYHKISGCRPCSSCPAIVHSVINPRATAAPRPVAWFSQAGAASFPTTRLR
jgi:hypothetical protein